MLLKDLLALLGLGVEKRSSPRYHAQLSSNTKTLMNQTGDTNPNPKNAGLQDRTPEQLGTPTPKRTGHPTQKATGTPQKDKKTPDPKTDTRQKPEDQTRLKQKPRPKSIKEKRPPPKEDTKTKPKTKRPHSPKGIQNFQIFSFLIPSKLLLKPSTEQSLTSTGSFSRRVVGLQLLCLK